MEISFDIMAKYAIFSKFSQPKIWTANIRAENSRQLAGFNGARRLQHPGTFCDGSGVTAPTATRRQPAIIRTATAHPSLLPLWVSAQHPCAVKPSNSGILVRRNRSSDAGIQ
jgi:hypothetical protein